MNTADFILKALELNTTNLVTKALEGLSDEDLKKQPNKDSNPIGWLLWHQSRAEDGIVSQGTGKPQVWTEGNWHKKFGMEADPRNLGFGHTMEQVRAFKAKKNDLVDYATAVRERTNTALAKLTPADLDKEVPDTPVGTIPLGQFLGILLVDHFHHSGQICYLRGWLKGRGWLPF